MTIEEITLILEQHLAEMISNRELGQPEKPEQEDDYAWSTVADYEKEVGFEVNDVFKSAWAMARTRLSYKSAAQNAGGS